MAGHIYEQRAIDNSLVSLNMKRARSTTYVEQFNKEMNDQVLEMFRSIPPSVQGEASLWYMEYSSIAPGDELDFFMHYYKPSWSLIPHIFNSGKIKKKYQDEVVILLARLHSMVMLLHSLDDHLHDGDIKATHTTVLIRSQAWLFRQMALDELEDLVAGASAVGNKATSRYYGAISCLDGFSDLDAFLDNFTLQWQTFTIAPVIGGLFSGGTDDQISSLQRCADYFGRAWRILDDIQDIHEDIAGRCESSVSMLLPPLLRELWNNGSFDVDEHRASVEESITTLIPLLKENLDCAIEAGRFCSLDQWCLECEQWLQQLEKNVREGYLYE